MEVIRFNEIVTHSQYMISGDLKEKIEFEIVPLFGNISCGKFGFADGEIEGYLEIPNHYLGSHEYFALKAKGTL